MADQDSPIIVKTSPDAFLGGSDMARLIAETDWSSSPVGPPESWPQSLRAAVGLMLPSAAQIVLFWGPEFVAIYNDAYAPAIGDNHPRALGRPAQENWSELWSDLEPLLSRVLHKGETVSAKSRPFYVERHGYPETVHFDISYSPVPDETGGVGGVLCIVNDTTEQVKAERRLKRVMETEAVGVIFFNLDGVVVDANDAFLHLTGYTREQVRGGELDWRRMTPQQWVEASEQQMTKLAETGRIGPYEKEYILADGTRRWMLFAGRDLGDGTIAEYCIDITNARQATEALRESEARLRAALEASESGTFRWNIQTNELDWDDALDKLFGLPAGVTARSLEQFISMVHPDERASVIESCERCAAEGADFEMEFRVVSADGSVRWLYDRGKTFFDDDGKAAYMTGACVDITDRKLAEQQRTESEDRLRLATEAADIGTWDFNPVTGELRWDDRCKELFGLSPEAEITYSVFLAGLHPDDRMSTDAAVQNALRPDGPGEYHVQYRTIGLEDGVERWVAASGRAVFTGVAEARIASRFIGTIIDISERVRAEQALTALNETLESRVAEEIERRSRAEEELRQTQKMETVGQLSGGIAHDFNNLLQVIQGNLSIVQRSLSTTDERINRAVNSALSGTDRAAALTKRLLAFSRRQPLDARAVDVNRLILDMTELLHRTLGETIVIDTKLATDLPNAMVDSNQLENAILNLAINARDAMPRGGRLDICTHAAQLDESVAVGNPGSGTRQFVCIEVRDNGEGMTEEVRSRAVEPFFSTKEVGQGTGLGLSMVYGFVRQSGGHLMLNSRKGSGTSVELYLPCSGTRAAATATSTDLDDLARGRGERVLLCEDDDDVRFFSSEALTDLGYTVIEARDAASALAALNKHGRVDLLFTDVVLPGGKTGADLAREARKLQPGLKVLFTTGYARSALDREQRGNEALHVLLKPFGVDKLASKMREMLD